MGMDAMVNAERADGCEVVGSVEVEVAGQVVWLLPGRAMWWPGGGALVVADVHVGKVDVFRRAGLPMPTGVAAADLSRLGGLINAVGARRLVVLGDLFHGVVGERDAAREALGSWLAERTAMEAVLVRGNHDRAAWRVAAGMGMRVVAEGEADGPFVWRHEPAADERGDVWAGHVHPAVVLEGWGRGRRGAEKAGC
ncbi:MAG: ligase-associated DNA damage response endonuclease PdeM, partial [Planctomycetota bacterium]